MIVYSTVGVKSCKSPSNICAHANANANVGLSQATVETLEFSFLGSTDGREQRGDPEN